MIARTMVVAPARACAEQLREQLRQTVPASQRPNVHGNRLAPAVLAWLALRQLAWRRWDVGQLDRRQLSQAAQAKLA